MLIDTHTHLPDDLSQVNNFINEASSNDVKYLILSGTDPKNNLDIINVSKQYKNIFITLGYHPEFASEITKEDINNLINQIKEHHPVAIGEIGLDYHYDNTNKDLQKDLFIKQLDIAEEYNLPVVIHSRDATEDTINILKKYQLKGDIHCFSGSLETAKEYIKMNYKLGIGGVLTFKNSHLKDIVTKIDLSNIILETDSPYLSPNRGEENSSKNIKIIAQYLSDLSDKPLKEIAKITSENAIQLFDLDIDN